MLVSDRTLVTLSRDIAKLVRQSPPKKDRDSIDLVIADYDVEIVFKKRSMKDSTATKKKSTKKKSTATKKK